MGLINIASGNSTWRGLDYYKENKVSDYKKTSDSEYEGIEEIYSIFSLDSVVSQFSSAYFAGDVGAVKQYLAASYKEEPETYYGKAERVMISEVKGLSDSGKKKVGEVCTVSVEFKESGNADYYICLRLEAVRESNGWKIQSYWLEG